MCVVVYNRLHHPLLPQRGMALSIEIYTRPRGSIRQSMRRRFKVKRGAFRGASARTFPARVCNRR